MMPRPTDPSPDILALLSAIGWREGDEAADLARVTAAGGQPRGRITVDSILAAIDAKISSVEEPRQEYVIPFVSPLSECLARAARNGNEIPPEIERRMRADKEKAKRKRDARKPKS